MDVLLSAVANELVSRFISFLVARCQKQAANDELVRLHRLLLRARIVVEEADGRLVTNQGMLMQLKQLREAIYRGYYVLDTFHIQAAHSERQVTVRPLQSLHLQRLQDVLESLGATLSGMKEFLVFLMHCRPILRQPYSTYLSMERCMFGRHTEKERIVDFLLQPCLPSALVLDVLPIIGPYGIGKRTLVEHVCNEERVREHFSQILQLDSDSLGDDHLIEHRKRLVPSVRSLIIIEFVRDNLDEVVWRRFCSICCKNSGTKVIVMGRTDQISSLGTVQALKLKNLHREEYWYFFKVLAFGSANPDDHPGLVPIAQRIATNIRRSFMAANMYTSFLRANLNAQFWRSVLEAVRKAIPLHASAFGEHPWDLASKCRPHYICNYKDGPLFLCYEQRKSRPSTQQELPRFTARNVFDGSIVPPEEKIDVLVWQSAIPPYCCYTSRTVKYAVERSQQVVTEEKHLKRKRGLQ